MKNKIFNKRNIIVSSLVLLVILVFAVIYYVDLAKFNSNLTKIDGKYVIRVSHLIVDKNEIEEDATISEITKNKTDSIIYFVDQMVPLTKDGEYLYADLSKYTNEAILKNVGDVVYTYNNVHGQKIDGCSYDKKTKILKIPFSYYEDENRKEFVPIQVELVSLMTKVQSRSIKTNYNVKKLITQSGKAGNEVLSLDTKVSLSNYVNGNLSLDDIKVFINGSDLPVAKEHMEYNAKNKVLTVKYSSVLINRLDIKLGNNIFKSASAYQVSSDYGDDWTTWSLTEAPSSIPSSWSTYADQLGHGEINHCSWNDDDPASCIGSLGNNDYDWQYYVFDDGNYHSRENGYGRYPFWARAGFVGHSGTTEILKFVDDDDYINLKCIGHADDFNMQNDDYISLDIDRVAYDATNRWAVLRITMDGGAYGQTGQAYIKITWPPETTPPPPPPESCHISVGKYVDNMYSGNQNIFAVATVELHDGTTCQGNARDTKYIYIDGLAYANNGGGTNPPYPCAKNQVEFDDSLSTNTSYSIQEVSFKIADLSQLSGHDVEYGSCNNCAYSGLGINISPGNCFYSESFKYNATNTPVCLAARFIDAQGNVTHVAGLNNYGTSGNAPVKLSIYNPIDLSNFIVAGSFTGSFTSVDVDLVESKDKYVTKNSFSGETLGNRCREVICKTTDSCQGLINTEDTPPTYCYSITKKDKGTNNTVSGATWTLVGADGVTYNGTPNGATVTWTGLPKQDYTLKEVTSPSGYWNEHGGSGTIVRQSELTLGDSCTPVDKKDTKEFYCLKVKKVDDATGNPVDGAEFSAKKHGGDRVISPSSNSGDYKSSGGIISFFIGGAENAGDYDVTETKAPDGYSKVTETRQLSVVKMSKNYTTADDARTACFSNDGLASDDTNTIAANTYNSSNANYTYREKKLLINWYKTAEDGSTAIDGAKFKVKNSSGKYITVNNPNSISDSSSTPITKACYQYSGVSNDTNGGTEMTAGSTVTGISMKGQVCVSGLPAGTYTIEETKPARYHTFGSSKTLNVETSNVFKAKVDTGNGANNFVNKPTSFEFTKSVSPVEGSTTINVTRPDGTVGTISLNDLTTQELQKLKFVITESGSNTPLEFVYKTDHYEYAGNDIDPPTGTTTTVLQLNSSRKLIVKHLEAGKTYEIKELDPDGCVDAGSRVCNGYGYYYPNYSSASDYQFTISDVYNSNAEKGLTNTPTEITFTKDDLYGYLDANDIVKFENQEEINAFDQITFKLKDANGNYLTLQKIGNSGSCNVEGSYAEYRYVPSDQSAGATGTELHTCGGRIKITHLCRESTYVIEEVAVPNGTVFTLTTPHPEVTYNIPKTSPAEGATSVTQIISDTPTRVKFEKIDTKYGYLINDSTTTFKVYQCSGTTECHPSDYSTDEERLAAGIKVLKFVGPEIIPGDQEDTGIKVYKYSLTGETNATTDIHPYNGLVVLRYLPSDSNYKYVMMETEAPKGYVLPSGRDSETEFTVVSTTVEVEEIDVPNSPTALLIKKYVDVDGDGEVDGDNLLGGAKFKVYKLTNYNPSLALQYQEKELLRFKTIKEGIYENKPVLDTDIITTCKGNNCSYVPTDTEINIGLQSMVKEGTALIQYLEYDTYYLIEEVEAPEGYSLPENDENRYTIVHIKKDETGVVDTGEALVNKPSYFTFYKFDEYNTPLDGATFNLQKLDNDKKYNTLKVSKETLSNGNVVYKADEKSELTDITTVGGKATVYYLEPGQYRIIEVAAPEGYELPAKTINVATFFVDNDGLVYGSNIITNKKPGETIEYLASDKAELIITIQTGKVVIKYGLIITALIAAIAGLVIFLRKRK